MKIDFSEYMRKERESTEVWSPWFARYPVKISTGIVVWMNYIYRKHNSFAEWEYREYE